MSGVVDPFDADVRANAGYRYTTNAPTSSVLANQRLTELTRSLVALGGRRVIDVGCGDGTYTHELFAAAAPAEMVGVDAAAEAIGLARERYASATPALRFDVADAGALPFPPARFDVAVVRGLLHHVDDPVRVLTEISRVAAEVCVIEPNGYNPVLKVIERVSAYHRAHQERSFAAARVRRWIRDLGGVIEVEAYAGLVPFFCPRPLALALKVVEPAIEALPVARQLSCAVFAARYRVR